MSQHTKTAFTPTPTPGCTYFVPIKYKKFELMLTRRAKAHSSSGSVY